MHLDVFKDDAFSFSNLVAAINKIPYVPTRLGSLGIFGGEGVTTTTVTIEDQNGVLTLVPTAPRGAPVAGPTTLPRRNLRLFSTVHLPRRVSLMADEVQGLRAFGSESETEVAMARLQAKMAVARRDLEVTHEWQRMGALKGIVYDADGTTVLDNYFTKFGVTQQTKNIALSNTATKVLQETVALKRKIEDQLGGVMMRGVRVLCSAEFFDAFTGHPAVIEAYKYQQSNFLRTDNRDGFEFGGVIWEEYRGSVGATRFVAANKAYAIPEGVPDLFKTFYAPAPYMDTVNTIGVPFYAKQEMMDYDKGVDYEVQSNPLHILTRPNAVVELTAT